MLINKILFISLSNVGDAIMTTPVLQALHDNYKDATIDIVADRRSSEVFLNCPFRGDIFIKNKKSFLRGVPELLGKLRTRQYDLIVDLRTDGLAYLLRGKKKLTKRHRGETGSHAVQQHMGVIGSIYNNRPIPDCRIWTGQEDENFARSIIGDMNGKQILALGPGANSQKKIWPVENYIALVNKLSGDFDKVILVGNRQDAALAKGITAPASMTVLDLCGRTTILQAAAVLQYANVFIGNDSGLGHLAAARGVPTITLFGPGEPDRYRPWSEMSQSVCGPGHNIKNVKVEDVIKCVSRIRDKMDNT